MAAEQISSTMTSHERRSVLSLCLLYVTRMLGLFMVLPVFAIYLPRYEGYSLEMLGLALGVYGLTQALFQLPFGLLSDKLGRKPLIIFGLFVFFVGSVVAASSDSIMGIIIGRSLQGAGAIASTIMAFVSDLTREESRSKAMAMIGASIGLSFGVAMVAGPNIAASYGLDGVFWLTAGLALLGILLVLFVIPNPQTSSFTDALPAKDMLRRVLSDKQLIRYDVGIFVLHMALTSMFVVVPMLLESVIELEPAAHGLGYLLVLGGSFVVMLPIMIAAETKNKVKWVFVGAIAVMMIASVNLSIFYLAPLWLVGAWFAFFTGFNLLEAMLPSLLSRQVFPGGKGTAMGVYSTSQFLGIAVGGIAGGWIANLYGVPGVFNFVALMLFCWLVVAAGMVTPKKTKTIILNYHQRFDQQVIVSEIAALLGVIEVTFIDQKTVAYVKIDPKQFEEASLKRFSAEIA